jgi:hypothetical protein
MKNRLNDIIAYQTAYYGATLYDCIMAVADVCDMDNDELNELEADLSFGPRAREFTLIEGELV